ncbi:hypothetical protein GQ607_016499 [Colletotrichum asianum]|uniref:Uncharacterized protein n=1 Tax=Colletotrichum asianum TaxID=702518 RepID=A0A8H3ZEL7_9PEZI|nr:hypothetical protein GQ607_016499 [Colletotrichum asianum]
MDSSHVTHPGTFIDQTQQQRLHIKVLVWHLSCGASFTGHFTHLWPTFCHFYHKVAYLSTHSRGLRFHLFYRHWLSRPVVSHTVVVLSGNLN